jgi:exoribonuclease R
VRFGEVFEGFIPARRLLGEFFELNPLGTALRGRSTGRSYRLGDGIAVRVESITRNEGKVELALAPIVRTKTGSKSGGVPGPSARARGGR